MKNLKISTQEGCIICELMSATTHEITTEHIKKNIKSLVVVEAKKHLIDAATNNTKEIYYYHLKYFYICSVVSISAFFERSTN